MIDFPDLTPIDPDSFYYLNGGYRPALTRATIRSLRRSPVKIG